jgi:hypothetical protein
LRLTLGPPIFHGTLGALASAYGGQVRLVGILVVVQAGRAKETLHMASIILFSTLWGFALKEWASASSRTRALVWLGISTLAGSTVVIGIGNMLAA